MKIALVRPNIGAFRSTDAMPPLAMGILAARSAGHEIVFYDEKAESVPDDIDADLVALSVETFTAHRAYQIADRARARGSIVVMGGYHPTFLPDEALEHADSVVTGDAEGAWENMLSDLGRHALERVYHGRKDATLGDYRIDRSIFRGKRYAPIELAQYGRGCRFTCDFCSIHSFYGTTVRVRPIDQMRAELDALDRGKLLFFVDDNLFSNTADLDKLLAAIRPLGLRWSCQISIDVARDPALLDRIAAAGCKYVLIGFESMEPENLKQMKKPWNLVSGDYRRVVRAMHERGIGVYGTFVFGYDHDRAETIERSLDFALEARLDIANFNPLTPTPRTGLYERLSAEKRLLSPRWWLDPHYRYGDPIFVPRGMTPEQLADGCFDAKKRFYAWSSIVTRVLRSEKPFSAFSAGVTMAANVISRREVHRKQGRVLGR